MRLAITIALICVLSCVKTFAQQVVPDTGYASIYPQAKENTPTSNGETYISSGFTACHSSLPYGTLVKVTNIYNKKSVVVRINDRFCQKNYRLLDLSKSAATEIGLFSTELPKVRVEVVGYEAQPSQPDIKIASTSSSVSAKQKVSNSPISQPNSISKGGQISLPVVSIDQIVKAASKSIKYLTLGLLR